MKPNWEAPARRRLLVLHNSLAGSWFARGRFDDVLGVLREHGCCLEVRRTGSPDETRQIGAQAALEGRYDVVVAAGGDGTIRAVGTGLIGTGVPLGIIPVGTGNVLTHEIGLSVEVPAIVDCLLTGRTASLRVAFANGQPFFLMVGAGLDGRVIARLDNAVKSRLGKLAYVIPVVKALRAGPDTLRVRVDGIEYPAGWVIVTLRRSYAGSFVLAPTARLEDDEIQTVLFNPRDRSTLLRQLVWLAASAAVQRSDVKVIRGSTIELASDFPVPVQVDGEPLGTTPVHISMSEQILKLIVPRNFR